MKQVHENWGLCEKGHVHVWMGLWQGPTAIDGGYGDWRLIRRNVVSGAQEGRKRITTHIGPGRTIGAGSQGWNIAAAGPV